MRIPGYWRLEQKLFDVKLRQFQKQNNFNPSNNFLVFADPRGGSTWLTELIKEVTQSAIIWEPLAVSKVKSIKKLKFAWRQFIPQNIIWNEAKNELNTIFKGQNLNNWLASKTSINELSETSNLLIKFCRGNQLLPWITKNFNFNNKPVYMIRHPFAVVASQLKQGGWNYDFSQFEIPKSPFNEEYLKHEKFLSTIKTKEEALTATWCLCNQIPLKHKLNNIAWITLNYEEFLLNPKDSLIRVFQEWNIDTKNIDKLNFKKPSITTVEGSPISGNAQIENWKNTFSKDQIEKMEKVLNYFDIKEYTSDPYPKIIYNYGLQQGL